MPDANSRTNTGNGVIKASLGLFVLSCLVTAVSFFRDWFYVSFDYKTVELVGNTGQVSAQGTQLWGLPFLFGGATLCIGVVVLIQLTIRLTLLHRVRTFLSLVLGVLLLGALLLFFPKQTLVELHHYQSPAYATFVSLGEGNRSFAGLDVQLDTYPDLQTCAQSAGGAGCPTYECVSKRNWWLGRVHVQRLFYPLLEEENTAELLHSRCRLLDDDSQVLEEHLPQMKAEPDR